MHSSSIWSSWKSSSISSITIVDSRSICSSQSSSIKSNSRDSKRLARVKADKGRQQTQELLRLFAGTQLSSMSEEKQNYTKKAQNK